MSLRRIINWAILQANTGITGLVASPFYQYSADGVSWVWACDVDIGNGTVLQCVPVIANNFELIYAQQGCAVALEKTNVGCGYAIVGLASTSLGFGHVIYVTFSDQKVSIARTAWTGAQYRPLTYGELGEYGPGGGYGRLPYGIQGRFTKSGAFISLVTT